MKPYLSHFDYATWFVAIALHAALITLLAWRKLYERMPFFFSQVGVCLISNVICYVTAMRASPAAYFCVVLSSGLIVNALLGLFLWQEVYLTTFGPRRSLPDWIWMRVLLYVGTLYGAVLAANLLMPEHWLYQTLGVAGLLNRTSTGMLATVSIVLLIYSAVLGISWRRHTLILTVGLAFSSIMELAASYANSLFTPTGAVFLRHSSTVAYLITLVLWILGGALTEEMDDVTYEELLVLQGELSRVQRYAQMVIGEGEEGKETIREVTPSG